MWFNKSASIHREEERNFIENREENIRVTRSLSQLSIVESS